MLLFLRHLSFIIPEVDVGYAQRFCAYNRVDPVRSIKTKWAWHFVLAKTLQFLAYVCFIASVQLRERAVFRKI